MFTVDLSFQGDLAGEPMTLRYYDQFSQCANCGRIYWPGTHFQKQAARAADLLQK